MDTFLSFIESSWPPDIRQRQRLLDPLCGAIGVALFVLVVYAGLAGSQLVERFFRSSLHAISGHRS